MVLLCSITGAARAQEPLLWFSFDSETHPLVDHGSTSHQAHWEGDARWATPGVAHLPNSSDARPQSRIVVEGDDLAVDSDFTVETRFKLASIGTWWGAYNGTPRVVARPGDSQFYEANYYIQIQSFGEKGNLLIGGLYNGEDWEEVQMGDRRGEPGVDVETWYTVMLQHVSRESTLTMAVFREKEEEPFFAERRYGVKRPHPSAEPLVIGHGGNESGDSWLDGQVDYVKVWDEAPELPELAELDLPRAPAPINLRGKARVDGVHLSWNASSDEVGLLYRALDNDAVAINVATFLDSCPGRSYVDAPLPMATVASYTIELHGSSQTRVSQVAAVPLVGLAAPRVEATFPTSVYLTWEAPDLPVKRLSYAVSTSQGETRQFVAGSDRHLTVWGLRPSVPCMLRLSVLTPGGSEGPQSAPAEAMLPEPTEAVTTCASMKVLVTVPTRTPGGTIPTEEVDRIRAGLELARLFYWRNSGCQLDIPLEFYPIRRLLAEDEFANDGLLWPQFMEDVLRTERVNPAPYGLFFSTYAPLEGGGNYGAMTMFDGRGYSLATYPLRTTVVYPGEDPGVNYFGTWLFCHELQHSVDLVGYEKSGRTEMWHGDKPLDFAAREGQQFSYQAGIFRSFDGYRDIKEPWGHLVETVDSDGDGFPDMDSRFPMDEFRFGSSPMEKDTDGDGLDDLAEFMAGIYCGSDPVGADTDGDTHPDGEDPLPLYAFDPAIPYGDWVADGVVEAGWLPRSTELFWTADTTFGCSTYLGWNENALVVGLTMTGLVKTVVELDAADDGWWHGRDNYRLVYDPETDSLSVAIMDATPETRRYNVETGGYEVEMWDTDSRYIEWRGRLVDPASIARSWQPSGAAYVLELALPYSEVTGLTLEPGKTLNLRIYFPGVYASLFENYELIPVTLAAGE